MILTARAPLWGRCVRFPMFSNENERFLPPPPSKEWVGVFHAFFPAKTNDCYLPPLSMGWVGVCFHLFSMENERFLPPPFYGVGVCVCVSYIFPMKTNDFYRLPLSMGWVAVCFICFSNENE